ncbi:MAG: serine/threonine protein kinase [Burkholderiaceae bacterium]
MNNLSSPSPARGVSHVDALPVGARLAEFEIRALLGVGGFGMVYEAFDHSLHRAVAIKEYMPTALAGRSEGQSLWVRSAGDQASYRAGLASFVAEARLLAQFDHPSLVKVFRFWEANNTAYMVMPLYSGMTLKQARARMRTPPPEAWLRKVLWSVLGALRVLHDGQTLHRDISPDNIFLQDNGPPVLLDLGAARHAINDQDRRHTAVLKVNYAPIEQYAEGDSDLRQGPWSDLYSLGAVVYGCLCNDTPLPATLRSIRDRMVPFSRVAKTVKRQFGVEYSASFVAAVSSALALRPEDRPATIDAFLAAMHMTAPPEGVEHFDFRAELGDIWRDPADPPGPAVEMPAVDAVSVPLASAQADAVTRAYDPRDVADTVFIDAGDSTLMLDGDSVVPDPDPKPEARETDPTRRHGGKPGGRKATGASPSKPRGRRAAALGWWGVGVLVLAVAGATVWAGWLRAPKTKQHAIITEMADPPRPLITTASLPESVPQPVQADLGASAALVAAEPSAQSVSAAMAGASRLASPASATPGRAAARSAARKPASEPVAPPPPAGVGAPPPPPPPEPPPVQPKPKPAPRPLNPQEACADAGFLARPLCIHQECQKPGQFNHPVCVESRRRTEQEIQRQQQTPN